MNKEIGIIQDFGFKLTAEPASIYPYAPVYKLKANNQSYILKRTRSQPAELLKWTGFLTQKDINIVRPVSDFEPNPRRFDDEMWILYPFIEGRTCNSSQKDLEEAGELLGKIHAASTVPQFDLPAYDWEPIAKAEIDENMELIKKQLGEEKLDFNLLQEMLSEYYHQDGILHQCQQANLPLVNSVWDYKASNLIYQNGKPVLIDPDSAGKLPRIFDLAIPLYLFHNDNELKKDWYHRVFNPEEWQTFYHGYQKYVSLSTLEKKLWQEALKIIYIDEVLWLLANDSEGWLHSEQSRFLGSLLDILSNLSEYKLG